MGILPALGSNSTLLQAFFGFGTSLVGLLALALAIVTVYQMVEIVDAYEKEALTVFGEFRQLLEPGISFVPPFVSRTYPFDMRTQTLDVPRQEAITRDNSPVTADAVVYIKVMDAKKAFLEVDDYKKPFRIWHRLPSGLYWVTWNWMIR